MNGPEQGGESIVSANGSSAHAGKTRTAARALGVTSATLHPSRIRWSPDPIPLSFPQARNPMLPAPLRRRLLPITLLSLALIALIAHADAADAAPALPPGDQAALDKVVDGDIAKPLKAYAAYLQAIDDASAKMVKDLEKLKTEAMKAGNLPLANAVDAEEKTIKGGGLPGIVAWDDLKLNNTDMLGNVQDLKTLVVGAWTMTVNASITGTITFNNDGSVTFLVIHGKYVIDAGKGTITITWDDGNVLIINSIQPDKMAGTAGNGSMTCDLVRITK